MKRSAIAAAVAAVLAVAVLLPAGLQGALNPRAAEIVEPEFAELQAAPAESGVEDGGNTREGAVAGEDAAGAEQRQGFGSARLDSNAIEEYAHAAVQAEHVPGTLLVELADGTTVDDLSEQLGTLDFVATESVSEDDVLFGFVQLDLAEGVSVEEAIVRLADVEAVQGAEPDYIMHTSEGVGAGAPANASAGASDSQNDLQGLLLSDIADEVMAARETVINDPFKQNDEDSAWMLDAINAYEAWDYKTSDHGVTVAVLDSGIQPNHEDLVDNVIAPYSQLQADDDGDTSDVTDVYGHGTHVAGIVAATANNGKGVAGVSYNAKIMPVQVIEYDTATKKNWVTSSVAARGVRYVLDYAEAHPEANVRVMNMSFGTKMSGVSSSNALLKAISQANEAGVLTVCASGNEGSSDAYTCFPSDYAESAIGVINVQKSDNTYVRQKNSNYNKKGEKTKELSAPGTKIYSTASDLESSSTTNPFRDGVGNDYMNKSGTSMATPCVAGVAALLFAADPSLTPAQVKQKLIDTAQDLNASENLSSGDSFDLQTGYGMVDAAAAIKEVVSTVVAHLEGDDTSTMAIGEAVQLRIEDADEAWTWASSDGAVATVDAAGLVTARGAGSATITATNGKKRLSRGVSVYDPTIQGETDLEFTSAVKLSLSPGNPNGKWTWTSSNPGIIDIAVKDGKPEASIVGTGVADITVSLDADPAITSTVAVTVNKGNLERAVLSGVADQVFIGEPVTLDALTVALDGKVLSADTDYDVAYADNVECGEATVTVTGKGNFENLKAATFRIGKFDIATDDGISVKGTNAFTYTGDPIEIDDLVVTHTVGGETVTLDKGEHYTLSFEDNTDAGTAYVTVTGVLPDYVGSKRLSYTINPKNIADEDVVVAGIEDRVYDGEAQTQTPALTYNGKGLVEGADYRLTYSKNTDAGTATLHIWGKGNFGGAQGASRDVAFQIAPASLADATVEAPAQAYSGLPLEPAVTVKVGGRTLKAGTDYTAAYSDNTAVGTAKVVVTGKGNYTDAASGTFTIQETKLGAISLSQDAYTFDGKAKTPAVTVKDAAGNALVEGEDYTLSYADNVAAGTALAVATGKGGYTGSVQAAFTIKPVMSVFAGSTRYDTACKVAQVEAALAGASYSGIIVVSGEKDRFADALSASGLSGLLDYPVLVVCGSDLTSSDRVALSAMKTACPSGKLDIVIVGGTAAVSSLVESQLSSWGKVSKRIAGANRYDTNAAVYEYGSTRGAWDKSTAFLATGANFPDALSVAPYLVANKTPIILTRSGAATLSAGAKKALANATRVIALGGTGVVSGELLDNARTATAGKLASRISGANRYETSADIVSWELKNGMSLEGVGIATGANFPDALASGFLLGKEGSVLCLVSPKASANNAMVEALSTSGKTASSMRVFGGTSAVSEDARCDMALAVGWLDYATSPRG